MTATLGSILSLVTGGLAFVLACAVIAGTALSLYLLLLAVASLRRPPQVAQPGPPVTRFAVLVPAHEEELVIGQLLDSINTADDPGDLFEVHVIADHCTDQTASIARGLGATVHERNDPQPRGKSHALNWLVGHLLARESGERVDAFVILDADSIVSPGFLRAMDARLRTGQPLVQGLVQIDDPGADRFGQLRALAYEFISHVRPRGRSTLGLSAGLRGNGMCIARDLAARFPWDPDSLTEDYELHARLLAAGLRVSFAPDAVVRTQLPQSLAVARAQSQRWERGRLDAMRNHVPALIRDGLRRRSWASIDGALELLIPPFSIFMALMSALLVVSLLSGIVPLIVVAAVGVVAQVLYTLRGLALASRRYPSIYRALLFVPVFVLWRVWQYVVVLTRRGRVQWTRTVRRPTR
jgi:cellulose synthase/poly-beta-1,6-N-acetylglucosamine synthase-like glycosyltransferase